jgi:hypothetical protein
MFVPSIVAQLGTGTFFKRFVTFVLRFLAVVAAVVGIVAAFGMLYVMGRLLEFIDGFAKAGVILGVLIVAVIDLVATYVVTHLLIVRSSTIAQLPESEFVVIPIAVVLFRLVGEVLSALIATVSLIAFVLAWLTGKATAGLRYIFSGFPSPDVGGGFIGGLMILVSGGMIAVLVLFLAYYAAEMIALLVRIAQNTKVIADATQKEESPSVA